MEMFCRTIFLLFIVGLALADKKSARIVIVGAGPSGIAAASKLLQNGFEDVLILEAEDRIGGRIFTTEFDGYQVDLGGQWVHGEKGNVAFELAAPTGLIERHEPHSMYYDIYKSPGNLLNTSIARDLISLYENSYDEADTLAEENNETVGHFISKRFEDYFAQHPEIDENTRKEILRHYDVLLTTYDPAESWNDIPAKGKAEYRDCEGDKVVNWRERGYSTILDILMKKIPNPEEELPVMNKTVLNTEVTKIDYSDENGPVKISTLDGKEYTADHVIMTPSLGVLKAQYETLFEPSLPESKINDIKNLAFGTVAKIYLAFNESWWGGKEKNNVGFAFLLDESERQQYENDPKKKWALDLAIYTTVEYKPRLLLIWVGGKGARAIEDVPDEEVLHESMGMLKRFLSSDYNVTEPTAMLRTHWLKNKHFRGTYSYRTFESDKNNAFPPGLAEPIMKKGKPVLMFAGEATSRYYYSTVHGAIGSGWREADRLIALYGES